MGKKEALWLLDSLLRLCSLGLGSGFKTRDVMAIKFALTPRAAFIRRAPQSRWADPCPSRGPWRLASQAFWVGALHNPSGHAYTTCNLKARRQNGYLKPCSKHWRDRMQGAHSVCTVGPSQAEAAHAVEAQAVTAPFTQHKTRFADRFRHSQFNPRSSTSFRTPTPFKARRLEPLSPFGPPLHPFKPSLQSEYNHKHQEYITFFSPSPLALSCSPRSWLGLLLLAH